MQGEIINSKTVIHPVNVFTTLKYVNAENADVYEHSKRLIAICEKSVGLSGRSLRKIPFLAHALYLKPKGGHSIDEFLDAMEKAVEHEKTERKHFI